MVLTPKCHSDPDLSEWRPIMPLVLGDKEVAVPLKEPKSKCGWPSESFGEIKCFLSALLRSQ